MFGITGLVKEAISPYIPDFFSERNSYNWYMANISFNKEEYIKNILRTMLTVEAGMPSYGRDWSNDDLSKFLEILSRPKYNYREINSELLNEVILQKDQDLIDLMIEDDEMLSIKYPVPGCGVEGEYYKVKDNMENLILVEIVGYDYKNKKCKVKDVFTNKETTILPNMLEKRAKDLTRDEMSKIDEKINKFSIGKPFFGFSAFYKLKDNNMKR